MIEEYFELKQKKTKFRCNVSSFDWILWEVFYFLFFVFFKINLGIGVCSQIFVWILMRFVDKSGILTLLLC